MGMRSYLPAPRTVDEALAGTLDISGLVIMAAVNSTRWFCSSTTASIARSRTVPARWTRLPGISVNPRGSA